MTASVRLPDAVLRLAFRPRVVHSLPGRVRIQLPSLKRVSGTRDYVVRLVVELVGVPDAIQDVQAHPAAGTVLIRYDAARVNERDIVVYLKTLFEIYLTNRRALDDVTAERWPAARERLSALVRGAVGPRLTLDPKLEIGTDVLA